MVDDGSSDDTPRILSEYGDRIRAVYQENRGVTAARLEGVRQAQGQWIGFMDSDDEVEPGMYERLIRSAQAWDTDIAHCGFQILHPDGTRECPHNTGLVRTQDRLTALRDLLEEAQIEPALCTKLYRRALFAGLSERMDPTVKNNEDMLMNFWLFSRADRAVYEDISPYHYILRENSASRRAPDDHILFDPIRVRQIMLDSCGPELRDDARRALIRLMLVSFRQVCLEDRKKYEKEARKLRDMIRSQREFLPSLSAKNAWQVRLASAAPGLFRLLWRMASALGK